MTTSADSPTGRLGKRKATTRRIVVAAQRLALERGLDGFTMEDLAAAADVSRRTLFNYFPSKIDACLGPGPEMPADVVETFCAGGPTGVLIDDIEAVVRAVLDSDDPTPEELRLHRQLITVPRMYDAVHGRLEEMATQLQAARAEREGSEPDPAGARLLIRLLMAVVDTALDASLEGDDRSLADLFSAHLDSARALFAPAGD